jgi:adenylate cyclase, class 2
MIEQEIKLVFESAEAARQAVLAAGGRLVVSRRLLDDRLFDTPDTWLRRSGTALRLRRDADRAFLTFKGPVQPGAVKRREELETTVGDADIAEAIVIALGFRRWFRSEKYREEYDIESARVAVDDTPIGAFVEIEADEHSIARVAARLGRSTAEYRLESYPRLFRDWCEARGVHETDMVFR